MALAIALALLVSGPIAAETARQPTIVRLQDATIAIDGGSRVRCFSSPGSRHVQMVIDGAAEGTGSISIEAEHLRLEGDGKVYAFSVGSTGRLMVTTTEAGTRSAPVEND